MLINRNIVALFALPFMASATASELSIGAGAAYNESPYRGYNENTKAIPLISYEGDSFLCSSDHVRFYSVAKCKKMNLA